MNTKYILEQKICLRNCVSICYDCIFVTILAGLWWVLCLHWDLWGWIPAFTAHCLKAGILDYMKVKITGAYSLDDLFYSHFQLHQHLQFRWKVQTVCEVKYVKILGGCFFFFFFLFRCTPELWKSSDSKKSLCKAEVSCFCQSHTLLCCHAECYRQSCHQYLLSISHMDFLPAFSLIIQIRHIWYSHASLLCRLTWQHATTLLCLC